MKITREYVDSKEVRTRAQLKKYIESLMVTLDVALMELDSGHYPNSCGIIQNSARYIDQACSELGVLREIKAILKADIDNN